MSNTKSAYDWLTDALRDSSQVVTGNRRLARVLAAEFGRQQIATGKSAWRSPIINAWTDWLTNLLASADPARALPIRINTHQSRVLWERCLRREVTDPLLNIAVLVRQARESWSRLHEFGVPLVECQNSAQGRDQAIFVRAATSYQSILEREHWIDEAGLAGTLDAYIRDGALRLPALVTIAGFDRLTPQVVSIVESLRASGTRVDEVPRAEAQQAAKIMRYEDTDAELRAAGAWARETLQEYSEREIAIVATHLDQDSQRCARLIREGLAPGWQTAGTGHKNAVNVSYGNRLSTYPAIAVALLGLRWLHSDLASRDVSTLLRSAAISTSITSGRSRLELALRRVPDRNWSPEMIVGELTGADDTTDSQDWLARIQALATFRAEMPKREAPSQWVLLIDEVLKKLNWPGEQSLNSEEFQLVNRWRELLNDVARLELVSPTMTLAEVLGRLTTMVSETIFQAESESTMVQLLGPLEAAGMHFDHLWITGLSAANWPPAGRPSVLIPRSIQSAYGMPDADPDDTLNYARRVLHRLVASAANVVGSFPLSDGDAEQIETELFAELGERAEAEPTDPGWYGKLLVDAAQVVQIDNDPVPPIKADEIISGGAATINQQILEPFAAFAYGRLGVKRVPGIVSGLAANIRGTLIHDALHSLYADCPARNEIESWSESTLDEKIQMAVDKSFWRHERHADLVLRQLFELERQRTARLLRSVVSLDRGREDFTIVAVEESAKVLISGIQLRVRIDRLDRVSDGGITILDYKTGAHKQFLDGDGEPRDLQLVVYAMAMTDPVTGLGLINVDSRSTDIDGAGRFFSPDLEWDDLLPDWKTQVENAAKTMQRGDVRVNVLQNMQAARPLALLSRIGELRHAD